MWVKEVIIDGFKSYAVRTVVNGWDPSFNAITGLNGSGKSNILDAICFVLGISNLSQVRVNNLTELVYKQGQARVTKATVTVVFDNSDPKMSPVGYEETKELTITRQIQIGGRNKYLINGAAAQLGRVQNLFHSVQLNVNNPHFLIMQGRITKVCNMKPAELLSLIEEAAGTRMYETKKKGAQKTIAKKQQKVDEFNKVLSEEITPQLDKLRKERSVYLQYQANTQEIERLARLTTAFTFHQNSQTLAEAAANIKAEEDAADKTSADCNDIKKQLNDNASDAKRVMELKEETAGKSSSKENDLQERSKVLVAATSAWTNKKDTLTSDQKQHTALVGQHKDNQKLIDEKQKELTREKKAQEKDNSKHRDLADRHASLSGSVLGFTVGGDDKKERGSLAQQVMAVQSEITRLESNMQDLTARLKQATAQHSTKSKLLKSHENEHAQLSKELKQKERELAKVEAALSKAAVDPAAKHNAEQQLKTFTASLAQLKDEVATLRSHTSAFDFQMTHAPKGFDRAAHVYGCVARLFTVTDASAMTALEVIGGGKLQNVIVDTAKTSTYLLDNAKFARRTTLVPLDNIVPRSISPAILAKAQKLVGDDKVVSALSLISFDPKLKPAMELVFGTTLVCADAKTAETLCYDKDIRVKCVTRDGDLYDPAGTLRGGSRPSGASKLPLIAKQRSVEEQLLATQEQVSGLQKRLDQLTKAEHDSAQLTSSRDLLADEVKLHTARLGQSGKAQLDNELQALQHTIDSTTAEHSAARSEHERSVAKCSELERSIKDFESERANKIKAIEKELAKVKAEMNASSKEAKKRSQALEKLTLESEQLTTENEQLSKQIAESAEAIARLTSEVKALEDVAAEKRAWFDAAKKVVDAEKEKITDADKQLAKLSKDRKKLQQMLTDKELEVKKLGHKVQRLISEQKEAKETVRAMAERHEWITAEKHLFGRNGSDYDFGRDNKKPAEASDRIKKLRSEQEQLSKKINKKVLGMFEKAEEEYRELVKKRDIVEADKRKIEQVIAELDRKKEEALRTTHAKVTKDFGSIFSALLPGTTAKLEATKEAADNKDGGGDVMAGLEMRVAFGGVWKDSLSELSGGQRSLLALSLILALLLFKPAPMYILDEIDAALDLSHTQNIGQMLKTHFPQSQFIVVSLKEGMFNNANVIFRTKFVDGVSCVTRTALAQQPVNGKAKRK